MEQEINGLVVKQNVMVKHMILTHMEVVLLLLLETQDPWQTLWAFIIMNKIIGSKLLKLEVMVEVI